MSFVEDLESVFNIFKGTDNLIKKNDCLKIFNDFGIDLREDEKLLLGEEIDFKNFLDIFNLHMGKELTTNETKEIMKTFETFNSETNEISLAELINYLKKDGVMFTDDEVDEMLLKVIGSREAEHLENDKVNLNKFIENLKVS